MAVVRIRCEEINYIELYHRSFANFYDAIRMNTRFRCVLLGFGKKRMRVKRTVSGIRESFISRVILTSLSPFP